MKDQPRKLEALQFLRGLAALLVVTFHVTEQLSLKLLISLESVFSWGARGVDLFFVISGFIIMFIHRKDVGISSRLSVSTKAMVAIGCTSALLVGPVAWTVAVAIGLLFYYFVERALQKHVGAFIRSTWQPA
ncbi:MAG: hypothetical protein WC003_05425 [Terrimicrobiaceae bacterium]